MTMLLDASVWLAALDDEDPTHAAARRLLERGTDVRGNLAALDLTLYEVANVAVVRWRSLEDAEGLVSLVRLVCADTLQRADRELLQDAATVAVRHGLTVHDGAYVAAARRNGWTLVSCDMRDLVEPGLAVAPDAAAAA